MSGQQSGEHIRKATQADFEAIQRNFDRARKLMARNGNPTQWGTTWPPAELVQKDIDGGNAFLLVDNKGENGSERILAQFAMFTGLEPTYAEIEGKWLDDDDYATMHRLAASGLKHHSAKTCLDWAVEQYGNVRCDTHPDNKAMQHVFEADGFQRCGLIHVMNITDKPDVRVAYQRHDH
ncbi:N-acetyltransferase [Bifidobacterium sp. ESL0745]|uniref:N-acetyltransferase n=1 Tax=Bifidobacterium sp. ESL0745 TaxID=2983226 RepID=UPI0023F75675|nr:N-acetyltransferase [Bifidobacterium sp. ESL0745]MDF7664833.1 N-acetyltransferase [Bifidobacterium sp. ESL0745]